MPNRRRRLPKLDACKVKPERFRRLSADQLMKVWGRLGASAPSRTRINSLVKGIVSNLAAAKTSESAHKGNPEQRRRSVAVYMGIVRSLEADLRKEQARSCAIRTTSHEAEMAMYDPRRTDATELWKKVRRLKRG